jgi:hypothetical protein
MIISGMRICETMVLSTSKPIICIVVRHMPRCGTREGDQKKICCFGTYVELHWTSETIVKLMFVYPLISSTLDESSNEAIPKLTTFMSDSFSMLFCSIYHTHFNPNIMTIFFLLYYFSNLPFLIFISQLFTLNENNIGQKIMLSSLIM